jgi:tetratricopeptide (TPR) repeat protein
MDPRNVDVILAFERVCERTGRWAELEQSFKQKAAVVAPAAASRLWFGIARVAERKDDMMGAREAYERAAAMDPALVEPVIALRKLASRRTDWPEVARLYELELALARGDDDERTRLSVELASIVGDRLGDSNRALELLDHAGASQISDPRTLDLYFRHNLAAERPAAERRWDVAGQTLERLLAIGNEPPDAADRYFRVGVAAEAAGQSDQALVFYSRAYSRSPNYRPTLERLSQLCFEKGQWDNAWRATEGLLERHRPNLGSAEIGDLLVRSALCDVHIGQRLGAMARLASLVEAGSGARDVADSWAAMRIEPRLLGGLEGDRRERVVRRLREALAIPDSRLQVARRQAWEILGAMAVVEQRWADAREALDRLAADPGASSSDRCGYLLAAGDIAGNMQKDAEAAARFYARARATNGGDPRLTGRIALKPARPPTKDEGAPTPPPAPGDRADGRDPSSHDETDS